MCCQCLYTYKALYTVCNKFDHCTNIDVNNHHSTNVNTACRYTGIDILSYAYTLLCDMLANSIVLFTLTNLQKNVTSFLVFMYLVSEVFIVCTSSVLFYYVNTPCVLRLLVHVTD